MTSKEITILHLYGILRDAVASFPLNPESCKQLQTFRVLQLDRGIELGTDSRGATYSDRDTVFFYSRAWNRTKQNPNNIVSDFPILTAFELGSEAPKGAFENGDKIIYTVEISVMDVYRDDCQTKPKGCESRSVNQIFYDTEILLKKILISLGGSALVEIDGVLKIVSPNEGGELIFDIGGMIQAANVNGIRFAKVEMSADRLFGTKTQIKFVAQNCYANDLPSLDQCFLPVNHLQGC